MTIANRLQVTLAILVTFWATLASAQTPQVVITGTVTDLSGHPYQNGSGVVQLLSGNGSGSQSWTTGGTNPVNPTRPIAGLDSFGHFSISLTSTAIIEPQSAAPQWQFSFNSDPSCQPQVGFTVPKMVLTVSQDISTFITAAPPAALPPNCAGGGGGGGNPSPPNFSYQYDNNGVFGGDVGGFTDGLGDATFNMVTVTGPGHVDIAVNASPAVVTNKFSIFGFASNATYGWQPGTTPPNAGEMVVFDAPVGNVHPFHYAPITRTIGTTFGDTLGSALSTGSVVTMQVPYACTVTQWYVNVDAGTATVDVWRVADGAGSISVANTITGSGTPALASGIMVHSAPTGWTATALAANDLIAFDLSAVATAKFVSVELACQ